MIPIASARRAQRSQSLLQTSPTFALPWAPNMSEVLREKLKHFFTPSALREQRFPATPVTADMLAIGHPLLGSMEAGAAENKQTLINK